MTRPLIVNVPHRLGKDEALRRLKSGIGRAHSEFAALLTVEEETWTGDCLAFRVRSFSQRASGTIDVREDHVHLEVTLPWFLAPFAHAAQRVIGEKGQLLLEKK